MGVVRNVPELLLSPLVLLADEMADVSLVVNVELLAVFAVLGIAFIDGLVIVPAGNLPLGIPCLEQGVHALLQRLDIEERPRSPNEGGEIAIYILQVGQVLGLMLELFLHGKVVQLV